MSKLSLFRVFVFMILFVSLVNFVSAADPGHGAGSIGAGTFESGNYIFPNNLTVGGNNFFVNNGTGYVGIGTLKPSQKLEIANGSIDLNFGLGSSRGINFDTNDEVYSIFANSNLNGLTINYGTLASTSYGIILKNTGYVGIGTNSPDALLEVAGGINLNNTFYVNESTGYVGIGTSKPFNLLDVRGSINASSEIYVNNGTAVSPWLYNQTAASIVAGGNISGSGTANYISKFIAGGVIGNSAIYESSGMIGIGTTSPNTYLEVGDGANSPEISLYGKNNNVSSAILRMSNTNDGSYGFRLRLDTLNNRLYIEGDPAGDASFSKKIYISRSTGDMVLPNDLTVGNQLDVQGLFQKTGTTGQTKISIHDTRSNTGDTALISFGTATSSTIDKSMIGHIETGSYGLGDFIIALDNTADTSSVDISDEKVRITRAGRVGIGTTAPSNELDVRGSINASSEIYVNNGTAVSPWLYNQTAASIVAGGNISGSGTANYISKFTDTGVIENSIVYDDGSSVGIGTMTPGAKLEVNGNLLLNYTAAANVIGNRIGGAAFSLGAGQYYTQLSLDPSYSFRIGPDTRGDILSGAGSPTSTYFFVNASSGKIGLGTTAPSNELDVRGSINASSEIYVNNGTAVSPWLYNQTAAAILGEVNRWNLSGTDLYPESLSYKVGVGTDSPSAYYFQVGNLSGKSDIDVSGYSAAIFQDLYVGGGSSSKIVVNEYRSTGAGAAFSFVDLKLTNNVTTADMFSIGILGSLNQGGTPSLGYGFIGNAYNNASIKWDYQGDVGIGVPSNTYPSLLLSIGDDDTGFEGETDYLYAYTGGTKRLTIDNSGDVGIGTANPEQKLDVVGNINSTSEIYVNSGTAVSPWLYNQTAAAVAIGGNISGAGTTNYISKFTNTGIIGNSIIYDNGTAVGIGTISPSQTLSVLGTFNVTRGTSSLVVDDNGDIRIGL